MEPKKGYGQKQMEQGWITTGAAWKRVNWRREEEELSTVYAGFLSGQGAETAVSGSGVLVAWVKHEN